MVRDSERDSEEVTRFDLSLQVFVSRLFGWTLLEGAPCAGPVVSKKKRGEKGKKKIRQEKFVKISQSSSKFVTVRQNFVKIRQDFVKIRQKIRHEIGFYSDE